ncbi:MAG: peptide chain release factor N(5)-glutamine methyltransferase [Ideonella sp.]
MSPDDDPSAPQTTVSGALRTAGDAGIERLDGQWLLSDLLGKSRTWLIAHGDSQIDQEQWRNWLALLARHAEGEPLAYLLGKQAFYGLTLQVDAAVLVPRSDTEALVEWALDILRQHNQRAPASVVDLGCGSGAIALALKSACPAAQVTAVDLSAEALAVATANGARLGLAVDWRCGNWWAALAERRFDLAVSNPPYIAADDPHLRDLRHEPALALVAADDGFSALRQIIAGAPAHLHPQSWLLLEHGYRQADAVASQLRKHGFELVQTRLDLAGRPRCTGGRWPGSGG